MGIAASLRAVQLEKRYGSVHALRSVDLKVRAGEFLTLLGPSGSGKTTLLNLIAGFQQPDVGQVLLDEEPITDLPAHARGFGMVFQSYALFPHMTVADNVGYPLRMRGLSRTERAVRVTQYLQLVELEHLADRFPAQLSGGQQQRVSVARALVFTPPVLLMDEPLGALDRRLRQSLQFEIKRLHTELQATTVYVTHDQEEALAMSDRVVVMRDGRIEQVGTPQEVYEEPVSAFVASFLGETNLIEADVVGSGGEETRVRHVASGQVFTVPIPSLSGRVVLSIRPDSMRIGRQVGTPLLKGTLTTVSFMGDAWRCEIAAGDGSLVVRQPVHEGMPVVVGEEAEVAVLRGGVRYVPSTTREAGLIGTEGGENS